MLKHDFCIIAVTSFKNFAASYIDAIKKLNELRPVKGFFWNEYSDEGSPADGAEPRKYFTGSNASHIDAIRATIKKWRGVGLSSAAADLFAPRLNTCCK